MPRGRPRKIVANDLFSTTAENKPENTKVNKKSKPLVSVKCDLCNCDIYSSPDKIILPILTGKANWHRKCKLDRLTLCEKCSSDLSTAVDDFILKRNPNLTKFE